MSATTFVTKQAMSGHGQKWIWSFESDYTIPRYRISSKEGGWKSQKKFDKQCHQYELLTHNIMRYLHNTTSPNSYIGEAGKVTIHVENLAPMARQIVDSGATAPPQIMEDLRDMIRLRRECYYQMKAGWVRGRLDTTTVKVTEEDRGFLYFVERMEEVLEILS